MRIFLKSCRNFSLVHKELLIGCAFVMLASWFLIDINFFDAWYLYTRLHEDWQLDEVLAIVIAILIAGTILAFRNIFRLQRTINQLETANLEISKHIEQRIRSEKLSALGALSSGMAHEINNALQPTIGLGQFILKGLEKSGNEKHHFYMQTIMDSTVHAKNIIDNVLEYSREKNLTLEQHNAKNLLSQSIEFTTNLFPSTLIFLTTWDQNTTEAEWEKISIQADKTSISQILMNIIKNSGQSMNNEGTIKIEIKNATLPSSENPAITIAITDEGTGIPQNVLEKIFDPFFSTKDISEGTGLGLATVFGLVKLHHGDVQVASELGKGSTFTIFIPTDYQDEKEIMEKKYG